MLQFARVRATVAVWLVILLGAATTMLETSALSIPTPETAAARAAEIAVVAAQIKNEKRNWTVGTEVFPFYVGPVATPGSLAERLRLQDTQGILSYQTTLPQTLLQLLAPVQPTLTSPEAFASFYDKASSVIEKPMSMDNSDVTFGRQRVTIKPMALKIVRGNDYRDQPFATSDRELQSICGPGVTWANIRWLKALYVEDFGDASQWNEPKNTGKYIPNVIGFFCFNFRKQQLLPIEIRFPDTKLAYTPMDSPDEWALAKMALESVDGCYHQMHHMADTHAVTIPIRVETHRNFAADHPVRALVLHHTKNDFGLEVFLARYLLSPNTPLDFTWGWGATGTTRFLEHQTRVVVANTPRSLEGDLSRRGIDNIPKNPFVKYARMLNLVIDGFVRSYIRAYYPNDCAVANDNELQSWAKACAAIPHLYQFPERISSRMELAAVLRALLYQSGVKHHVMNGVVTWQSMSLPFSPSALWKPLPTQKLRKGEKLDLMAFSTPASRVNVTFGLTSLFYRPAGVNDTWMQSYSAEPFKSESRLASAIDRFKTELQVVDRIIAEEQKCETFPYEILRPSRLPFSGWI